MSDSREVGHVADYGGGEVAQRAAAATSIPMEQQLQMMHTALTDPNVDPAKAREMFTLMREMQNDAKQAEFNRAKAAAIRAMPAIYKRGENEHLKARYAKFEDLHRAAMPVLARHGLTLDFRIGSEGRNVTVQPILRHDNGYVEEGGIMSAPPTSGKGINAVQEVAITASYLKRHSMKAMLNIIEDGEDTDGVMPRDGDQLNDRQERLLVDAQEAADRGEYGAFYQRLNTKDKAVLVSVGAHSRLGGGRALPGPTPREAEPPADTAPYDPAVTEAGREATPEDEGRSQTPPGQFDISTPDGWTAKYEADCAAAPDRETLQRVQAKGANGMARLKAAHPELHQRAVKAGTDALARLSGDSGGGLFAGDQ